MMVASSPRLRGPESGAADPASPRTTDSREGKERVGTDGEIGREAACEVDSYGARELMMSVDTRLDGAVTDRE